MFKLIQGDKPVETKLEKRLRALPHYQLQGWADTYLNEVGQYLLLNGREGGREALDMAEQSAAALMAVVQELKRRS